MRSFILLLKKVGLLRIVAVFIALVLIMVAILYIRHQPKLLDPSLQAKFDQGKYAKAIPEVEAWVKENPKDVNAMESLAALYIQKASNEPQVEKETLIKARDLLASNVRLDPLRDESFRLLGATYLMQGNTQLAYENFMRAVRISKNRNVDALVGLAMIDEYNKDWSKASGEYKSVLLKDPKNEAANLGIARFYISKGDANKAMDSAWLVAHASSNNASLGEAYSIIGVGMKLLGQTEPSQTYLEKSISYRPNNIHTLVLLGEVYIQTYPLASASNRQDVINKIITTANKAIALDPNYIHSQTLLYKAYLLQNKYAEANIVGKKIVLLLPSDKTLTTAEKAEYKKFYSGEVTSVKINSVKVTGSGTSSASTTVSQPITKTKK